MPRKLGPLPVRLAARSRRDHPSARFWLPLGLLVIGLAIAFGGPGKKWYYGLQHYRWLQAAQAAFERGDLATTSWTARRVLDRDVTNLKAVQLLAEAATRGGTRDAVYWRARMVELDPDNANNLLAWARTAQLFDDLPTAVLALNRVAEIDRQRVDYAEVAAAVAEAQGDTDLAARHLEAALALTPGTPQAELRLAAARLLTKSESTRSEGRATLDRLKQNSRWRREALIALAREALASRRVSPALEYTRELFEWNHRGADEWLLRAEALRMGNPRLFPQHLAEMQAAATQPATALQTLTPAQLLIWMGRNELRAEALAWSRLLPPETGNTRPITLTIAQLHADARDWLSLRALTKDPSWRDDDPLRLAYLALALQNGPAEYRSAGQPESLWYQALKLSAKDPARLERLANLAVKWRLPGLAEKSWWALANAAADPEPALAQLARIYHARNDPQGRYRVARWLLELHAFDRFSAAETAYLGLLLDLMDPDPHELADRLRRQPPLSAESIRACAFSLWRRDRLQEAVALFETLPIATREEPSVAWFYGTLLRAAGDTLRASRYLALGAGYPRSAEEDALFREARQSSSRR